MPSCISFIEQNATDEKAAVLITTSIEDHILQKFEMLHPIEAILILSTSQKHIDTFPSKVVGIYPQIENLIQRFRVIKNYICVCFLIFACIFALFFV